MGYLSQFDFSSSNLGRHPWPEVETSNFAEQWKQILEDPQHADVTFIVEGQHHLKAHKIVLGSTSSFFKDVFFPDEGESVSFKNVIVYGVINKEYHGLQLGG